MKQIILAFLLFFPIIALADALIGDYILDGGEAVTVKYAVINEDGADSDEIVAAVAGKTIKVLGFVITCSGAGNITFEDSAGTDVYGPMPVAANGGFSAPPSELGYFKNTAAKALHLLKSAAVNCGGGLTYVEVD